MIIPCSECLILYGDRFSFIKTAVQHDSIQIRYYGKLHYTLLKRFFSFIQNMKIEIQSVLSLFIFCDKVKRRKSLETIGAPKETHKSETLCASGR